MRKAHILLKSACEQAVLSEVIPRNPLSTVRPPKAVDPMPNALSDRTRRALLTYLDAAADTPYNLAVLMALSTGMREGELCGLRWADVDLRSRTLWVRRSVARDNGRYYVKQSKTRSSVRDIPLTAAVIEKLRVRKNAQETELIVAGIETTEERMAQLYVLGGVDGSYMKPHGLCLPRSSRASLDRTTMLRKIILLAWMYVGRKTMRTDLMMIAQKNNGVVSSGQATEAGIARRELSEAVERAELVRIARGVYALPDAWEDEFALAQHRFSRGIFSHETALYLHGLTDRAPEAMTMTFPRGYNTKNARTAGVDARTVTEDLHSAGSIGVRTPYGNTVTAYCAERAICDLFRSKSFPDLQLAIPAIRAYLSSEGKNTVRLMEYARLMKVEAKLRPYVEAML